MKDATFGITFTLGTPVRIVGGERVIARFALIAAWTSYIGFAVAFTGDRALVGVGLKVTDAAVCCAIRIAVTGHTHIAILQILGRIMEVAWFATLAVVALCVVLTFVAMSSGSLARRFP